MISTDSCSSNLAEHQGDQFSFDYRSRWPNDKQHRQQRAIGIKGQPQVWRREYHDNKALGKPTTTRQVAGGGLHCKRGRGLGGGVGGPKFRPTRAATGENTSQVGDINNNRVFNCHLRTPKAATTKTTTTTTTTTIRTKKTTATSRRQAHSICTQRFKHNRWLLAAAAAAAATVGKGGKRAAATTTDCGGKFRQRDPHRRGYCRNGKTPHHTRCDNNNLYHHPQHRNSLSLYRHDPQKHRPLVTTATTSTVAAKSRAAHQPRWVPAIGRQFRAIYCCSSSGRRSEGGQQSVGAATSGSSVLPANSRSTSLPVISAESSLRLFAKTTTFPPSISATPAAITSCTASSCSDHKPLRSCLSYPQVPSRRSQEGPVVVALPFTRAPSYSSFAESPRVARESRSWRSSSVGCFTTIRPVGQCRSTEAAEHDPTRRTTTNIRCSVQESTSESVTVINCQSTLSMKSEDYRDMTTIPSSKPSMTSITNDQLVATAMGAQSLRATGHHHHRANNRAHNNIIKPLVPRHNNKPLLETPSTPPIINAMQQSTAYRAQQLQQQQQRSNATSKRVANEGPSHLARNQRGPSNVSQPESPAVSKTGRSKGGCRAVNKQPDVVAHQVAASPAQDVNNNKFLDELQANVHSLESVGQRARMAISIYDPLPAQERQEHAEDCNSEQSPNQVEPSSPSTTVNRPTNLNLDDTSVPAGNIALGPRRRPPRRRESLYGDRFLKSPTIPEEPPELSALGDDELAALGQQVHLDATGSRTTKRQSQGNSETMTEGFLVATIEPEWGGVSKTLIVHSNATVESLTLDVLKRLIEIEHDQQSSVRARMRGASDVHPREKATSGRRNRAAPGDTNKLQELECEAKKLAKMFKQQLEIQQQQRAQVSSMTLHDDSDSTVSQKCDPTAMSRDEQARFFNPNNKPNDRHKPKCVDKDADKAIGDHDQDGDCKSAYDFRCSCCCLHLVNQPKRADGETWCCCGCS